MLLISFGKTPGCFFSGVYQASGQTKFAVYQCANQQPPGLFTVESCDGKFVVAEAVPPNCESPSDNLNFLMVLYANGRYIGCMLPFFVPLIRYVWLPAASFLAGVLNTIAGGGSFLSLPALLASTSVIGVGAVTAQATNTVALWPGQLTSMVAFRGQLRAYGWKLAPLALVSGVGGWLGGFLLLKTGNQMFRQMLPWLLLFAAGIFLASFPLGRWLSKFSDGRRYDNCLLAGMLLVSVYVGFFGAGGGFLVMALFGICGVRNIHEVNALKVVTATVSIGIPAITFIVARRVAWQFCLEMGVVAGLGGYLAAHYSPRVNPKAMRWAVAMIGFVTAGYFFVHDAARHAR